MSRLLAKRIEPVYALARALGLAQGAVTVPQDFYAWSTTPDDSVAAAWQLTSALIEQMADEVRAAGSEFAVFYIPSPAMFDEARWEATRSEYGLNEDEWSPEEPRLRLREICERIGVMMIDPTDRLRAADSEEEPVYLPGDGHWSAAGHRVVARAMADHLLNELQADR